MENPIILTPSLLNKLFPFYFTVNNNLEIESVGKSLEKLHPNLLSLNFNEIFVIKRPLIKAPNSIEDLYFLENSLTIIELNNKEKTILRGQFEFIKNQNKAFFFGTLYLEKLEAISINKLSLNDFALHDSTIDFLHLLKTKDIAKDDLTELIVKLKNQQSQLSKSNSALYEQRKFYDLILNNTPADIAVFNSKHEYIYINPNAIKNDELRNWMIGKKDIDYLRLKNKPLSIARQRSVNFNEAKKSKQLVSFEEKLISQNGEEKWILRNFYPVINNSNEVVNVIGYGIDITYIKNIQKAIFESERKYRELFNNNLAVIVTHDLDGNIVQVNPTVEVFFGYKQQECISQNIENIIPKEDKRFLQNYLKEIFKTKQFNGIGRFNHKNGTIVYTYFSSYLKQSYKTKSEVITFAIDVTDRIKAEKALEISKKNAEASAHAKQVFLASMSHEIRTPLNIVFGLINLLTKTNINPTQKFYLDNIQSTSQHLLNVLNDILDLAKIESGKLSLKHTTINLKNVVYQARDVISYLAEEKGIFLNINFDNRISVALLGDSKRINQLLLNILSNAIKFTDKGSIDIKCNLIEETNVQQNIEIIIKDTGIGINSNFSNKVFEKFSQADIDHNSQNIGTGLGMSICKEIVELMKGKITIESEVNIGTTVKMALNFEKANSINIKEKKDLSYNKDCIKNKKIIIADDNSMNRKLVSLILENYGAIVTQVTNGLEVIILLKKHDFDAVLMDIEMPILNGVEATLQIREILKSKIPIIPLTAHAFKDDKKKFVSIGMNYFISKPFNERDLIEVLIKVFHKNPLKLNISNKKNLNYDLTEIEEKTNGNTQLIAELINLFILETQNISQEITIAIKNNDYEKIRKLVHKIKPSLITMGVIRLIKTEVNKIENTINYDSSILSDISTLNDILESSINQLKSSFYLKVNS